MKIISKIKSLFRASYRLSVIYTGETNPRHIHGLNGRLLRNMGKNSAALYWTLYKVGPFGLPERPVEWGGRSTDER